VSGLFAYFKKGNLMQPDITITETIEGYTRPRARTMRVIDLQDTPEEAEVQIRGPQGKIHGAVWVSKADLVKFAREIIAAYDEENNEMDIHSDETKQHIDVRLYFGADLDRKILLEYISDMIQGGGPPDLISAYELVNDGFAHLVPADKPLKRNL
jgi:hypothetical protein